MAEHPTEPVRLGHYVVDIDVEIVPLITALHEAGITTMQSCQDVDGRVALVLASVGDLAELLAAVGKPSNHATSIYQRVRYLGPDAPYRPDEPEQWRYVLGPYPIGEGLWPQQWDFEVTVEFPRADLPEVTQRVEDDAALRRSR